VEPTGTKHSCLSVLPDKWLLDIYEQHKAGQSFSAIARTVQSEWKLCQDVTNQTCRLAIVKLVEKANAINKGDELYKDIERGGEKGQKNPETQRPSDTSNVPSIQALSAPPSPDELKKSHDPQVNLISLIQIQFSRLANLIEIEKEDKIPLPEITRIVDNIRTLEKDYATLDGGATGSKNKKAGIVIEKINMIMAQVENRSAVAETLLNFPNLLEQLAIPVLPEGVDSAQLRDDIVNIEPVINSNNSNLPIDIETNGQSTPNESDESEQPDDYDPNEPDDLSPW